MKTIILQSKRSAMYKDETIDLMEPMLPSGENRELEDLVVSLIQATSSLKAILKPRMTETLGNLVRNLIEGHNTTPRDIEVYHPSKLSKVKQVLAVTSSHHRLLWIHPFYDGNGRVARLFSHAYFKEIGIGSSIWSVSRGLARKSQEYKKLLMAADRQRINDLDGRGNLSLKALYEFVYFFLETAIDQVNFMKSLIEPETLIKRLNLYINEEIGLKKLPEGSFALLKEVILFDEVERGSASQITGYQTRQARTILNTLCKEGFLVSDTPKSAVRIVFPLKSIDRIFPSLYPS